MRVEICVKAPHECTITSGHDNRKQAVTIGAGETRVHTLDVASRLFVKACDSVLPLNLQSVKVIETSQWKGSVEKVDDVYKVHLSYKVWDGQTTATGWPKMPQMYRDRFLEGEETTRFNVVMTKAGIVGCSTASHAELAKEMGAEADGYIIFTATQKDGLIVDEEATYHATNIKMARLAISQCLFDASLRAHVEEYKGSPVPPPTSLIFAV